MMVQTRWVLTKDFMTKIISLSSYTTLKDLSPNFNTFKNFIEELNRMDAKDGLHVIW